MSPQMQMAMMQQLAMQQQQMGMNPHQMYAAMQAQAAAYQHGQGQQQGSMQGMGSTLNPNAAAYDFKPAATEQAPVAPQPAVSAAPASSPTNASNPEVVTVGIFLEEIAFFLEDMNKDLWWLMRVAHQSGGPPPVVQGIETLQSVDPAVEAAIEQLKERADLHAESHTAQVRAKIVIIPSVSRAERALLGELRKLKFHCLGHIEVFPCMKEANNAAIWQAYFNCVAAMEPQWMMKSDGPGSKPAFARCAVVVPVHVNKRKKEISLLQVWCPEKKKRHWSFPEGDTLRGADRSTFDTCRRQFLSRIGRFFDREWSDCMLAPFPTSPSEWQHPGVCVFVKLETDGHRYPCRPHFFIQVTDEFYDSLRLYEDANGVIKLPQPKGDFVHWDDLATSAYRVHKDGVFFAEHEEARWVTLDYETGTIRGDDSRQLRKENADIFKQQPEKVWKWLAEICGLDPVQRSSALPSDFPEDGPFAVRMSGIDKTATDEDIQNYFEERDAKVKAVEQFDVPRHTARIDFFDKETLEVAIQLSGHNLLRRKVKVELWSENYDTGPSAAQMAAKPLKPYTGPLPDAPPYKVIVRGLDKSVTERDLGYFFWDRDCECTEIVYPLKNERHGGSVEFKDQESLRKAMGLNSAVFKGREIMISLPSKEDNRPSGGGGGGGRMGGGKGGGRGDDRGRRDERPPPSRAEFGTERPRLELKPRSKPMPGEPGYREERVEGRSNPFGNAMPRDDRYKSTRADADDNWRR
eukprot:TRINITY_DN41890_c0_g1_i1.p1 TRINITY_DN41890_c0_g1~~TRINITY_DN41890_c0_g1_i1.p1  ORF type:complete len:817 (-),score=193.94 TRINITY_DN41890_c0_g1_i1:58-2298(-)